MAEMVQFERDGFQWTAAEPLAEVLRSADCPPLHRPEDCPAAEVVKRGRNRQVYRVPLAGQCFYLKQILPSGPLGQFAARRRVHLEWEMSEEALRRGIPAPEPVAFAYGPSPLLMTREIADAVCLRDYVFESCFEPAEDDPPYPGSRPPELVAIYRRRRPGSEEIIKELAGPLAHLVALLHRAGAYFPDLHPGNILLVRQPEPVLYLIDLGRLTVRSPRGALLKHLVFLNNFFGPITTQTERFHFWKALGKYHDLPIPRPEQIERAAHRQRREVYRRRDRRWAKVNKYVARLRVGRWGGKVVTDWRDAVEGVLRDIPDPVSADGTKVLKHSKTSTVVEADWSGRLPIVLKRDNRRGAAWRIKSLLLPSRAARGWRTGYGLLMRGIPTARPVAVLERRAFGILTQSLFATEKITGAIRLDRYLGQLQSASARHRLIEQLARLIERMHRLGISQRDLKALNILVRPDGEHPRLYLVDLDGLRFGRRVWRTRRLQNLMRLNVSADQIGGVSRCDRLRFLRAYLRRPGQPAVPSVTYQRWGARKKAVRDMRQWWHEIESRSRKKWQRLRRKSPRRPPAS